MMKGNKTKNKTGRRTYNATMVPTVKKIRHNVKSIKNEPKEGGKGIEGRVRRRSVGRFKSMTE